MGWEADAIFRRKEDQMDEIKFDKKNYRKHTDKNLNLIKKSLEECGAGRSILVDKNGEIIAGNATYQQAQAAKIPVKIIETDGKELVVVKRTDLDTDDEKRKKLALLDNSTSNQVEWDIENLGADFDLKQLPEFGIEFNTNFDELDFTELTNDISGSSDMFAITFNFPIEDKERIEAIIKREGKQTITERIMQEVLNA